MLARSSQFSFFPFLLLNEWRTLARATAPRFTSRAQNLIRPVESQEPGVLKKIALLSDFFVNQWRRNKRFLA